MLYIAVKTLMPIFRKRNSLCHEQIVHTNNMKT
jgi:hypothetical protein